MAPQAEGFIEAHMHLACGTIGRDIADQGIGDVEHPGVDRANLAPLQGKAVGPAKLVQLPELRHLNQVLGMPEQIHDGNDTDADSGCLAHELLELAARVGVPPGYRGEARELDGVLQVDVELAVAPVGVPGKLLEEPVQALDLPRQVPLEGLDHGGCFLSQARAPASSEKAPSSWASNAASRTVLKPGPGRWPRATRCRP